MKFNCFSSATVVSLATLIICIWSISKPSFELRISNNVDQKRDNERATSGRPTLSSQQEEQCTGPDDDSDSSASNSNHSISISGYMTNGEFHDEPPGWLVTFWSTERWKEFGYFAGIGIRISDALFLTDSETIVRSDRPDRMCVHTENNILTKNNYEPIKTLDFSKPRTENSKSLASIRIAPLSKHIAIYKFHPMIHPKDRATLHAYPVFKMEVQDIPLLQDNVDALNCTLFTYVLVDSISKKAEFKSIPVIAKGVEENTKTYMLAKFTAKDEQFKFCPFMAGSPIFCNHAQQNDPMKFSFITEWQHEHHGCRQEFLALRIYNFRKVFNSMKGEVQVEFNMEPLRQLPKH